MKRILLMLSLLAGAAHAQEATVVKEQIISDKANAGWSFGGEVKLKEVEAAGLPGGKAVQARVPKKGQNPWDIQASLPMQLGIEKGDQLTFGFYARAVEPDPGKETASIHIRFQRKAAPYDAALEGPIEIGRDWRFYCLAGPSTLSLAAADFTISVQLAADKRVLEFGPYLATRIAGGGATRKSGLPCGEKLGS